MNCSISSVTCLFSRHNVEISSRLDLRQIFIQETVGWFLLRHSFTHLQVDGEQVIQAPVGVSGKGFFGLRFQGDNSP